jgi:hypothetical protein
MARNSYGGKDEGSKDSDEGCQDLHVPGVSGAVYETRDSPSKPTLGSWNKPAPSK